MSIKFLKFIYYLIFKCRRIDRFLNWDYHMYCWKNYPYHHYKKGDPIRLSRYHPQYSKVARWSDFISVEKVDYEKRTVYISNNMDEIYEFDWKYCMYCRVTAGTEVLNYIHKVRKDGDAEKRKIVNEKLRFDFLGICNNRKLS